MRSPLEELEAFAKADCRHLNGYAFATCPAGWIRVNYTKGAPRKPAGFSYFLNNVRFSRAAFTKRLEGLAFSWVSLKGVLVGD